MNQFLVHYDMRLSEIKQGDTSRPVTLPSTLTQLGMAHPFIDPATCWIVRTHLTLSELYGRLIVSIGREDRLLVLALDDRTSWIADPRTTDEANDLLRNSRSD